MSLTADNVKKYLDSKDVRYEVLEEGERDVIAIGCQGEKAEKIRVIFFIDDDGQHVAIRSFGISKVPEEKLMPMYVALNELNCEYRWMKFYVDGDNEIVAADDAILSPETAGEECFELLLRSVDIIDKIYPSLMKIIWA